MTPYATCDEFTMVYSLKNVGPTEIRSVWLPYGTLRVNELLGGVFTIPFSSNNNTARDLSIHFAYLGYLLRTKNQTDSKELSENLMDRISTILEGNNPMILDDGSTLYADKGTRNDAWSNTKEYKTIFDMRGAIDQRVDPDQIDDLWDEDV